MEKDYRLSGVTSSAGRTLGFFENILRKIENIFESGGGPYEKRPPAQKLGGGRVRIRYQSDIKFDINFSRLII
ncbi:hypothetical protein H3H37_08140 [Duganella sp. LX20W]|uniref:Uncharacterized protein n=1 Tax=Rugamonas brunnea TaxID=2758569 RepID=A0A7W2ER19_9BURK|nr:hypothetical protein [Rugamonas brunnea]MBA5637023.1 hypothetical protein [Rugamonas brunnea]